MMYAVFKICCQYHHLEVHKDLEAGISIAYTSGNPIYLSSTSTGAFGTPP